MNKHLELIKEHNARVFQKSEAGAPVHFSDMDIVKHQALLMHEGSEVLQAIKAGEMVEILLGLVNLATVAVAAVAARGVDIADIPDNWRHDGSVLSLMRMLSDKISQCSSGASEDYSAVYCLCVHLTRSFINADFDKAFQVVHEYNQSRLSDSKPAAVFQPKAPDLSDCMYE